MKGELHTSGSIRNQPFDPFHHRPVSSPSFDGLEGLAEQEEFLPHKGGAKKDARFTDVSARG